MLENNKHMTAVLRILNINKKKPKVIAKVKMKCSCGNKYYATVNLSDAYKDRCDLCKQAEDNLSAAEKYSANDVGVVSVAILSHMFKQSQS